MDLFKFMKNWTLPLAMLAGVIGYFVFANFTFLEPTKPFMNGLISFLTPSLIFAQLLLTFCKIEPKELVLEYGMAGCWLFKPFLVVLLRCC